MSSGEMLSVVSAHATPGLTDICYTKDGRFLRVLADERHVSLCHLLAILSRAVKTAIFTSSTPQQKTSNTFVVRSNAPVWQFMFVPLCSIVQRACPSLSRTFISLSVPIAMNSKCVHFPKAMLCPVCFTSRNPCPPCACPIRVCSSAQGSL